MNYSNYRFTLDTQSNISQISLPVRTEDTSRRLYIDLTDGGIPYTIEEGCRAVFCAKKTDGSVIANDCVIEKNTTIIYDLTAKTTNCRGVVDCEIRLYGINNEVITSPRFIIVVNERVAYEDDYSLPENELSTLDNIAKSETARVNAEVKREAAEASRNTAEAERQATHAEMTVTLATATEVANELERKLATGDYNGEDGLTPHIGANGNWFIGDVDTGVAAGGARFAHGVTIFHYNDTMIQIYLPFEPKMLFCTYEYGTTSTSYPIFYCYSGNTSDFWMGNEGEKAAGNSAGTEQNGETWLYYSSDLTTTGIFVDDDVRLNYVAIG